jgi:signal transduction histidine kinase
MAAALAARGGVPPPHVDWVRQLDNAQGLDVEWVKFAARARIDSDGSTLWDCAVNDVTPQTRAELELRESREELRELALHLTHVREEERESIAREIHDDVGSTLFAAKYNLAWLKLQVHDNDAVTAKHLQMDQLLDSAIHASTRIMHDLRPGILDEGIVASLEWQARSFEQRMGIACTFKCSQEDLALDRNWSIALFRICQEALNNVAKHAHATVVVVTLEVNERKIELEVRDNGIGVSPGDARKLDCFGLRGMRERVESLGGTLRVSKGLEWGTTVAASFPRAGALLQLPLQPELAT